MFCRNITSFICIFVTAVMATVHSGSHSITEHQPLQKGVTTPTTQLHGGHGRIHTSAAQPTTSRFTLLSDATVPHLRAPAPADSGATPTTQAPSNHSGPTPASAAPTTAARHTPTPDYAAVCPLWSLSTEEKNRKLIKAAMEGAVGEVEALLAAGADLEAKEEVWGYTALHRAAMLGHVEVARRLLAAGAAVEARDSIQGTPLHAAARRGPAAMVRLLVEEASADLNARDAEEMTPLHTAAYSQRAEAAAALVQLGADRGATDKFERTPLDVARQINDQQLIDILT